MSLRRLWVFSGSFSVVCLVLLLHLWSWHHSPPRPAGGPSLESAADVDAALATWEERRGPLRHLPTGVFVQSLRFLSATDVHVTGYVWQKLDPGGGVEPGFTFPEQVDALQSEIQARPESTTEDGRRLLTWYFEATLRQKFAYDDYPFDHKTVWLRFWAEDWSPDVVLVPDLASYDSTAAEGAFGVEEGIVLGAWDVRETFFDYSTARYDTDFGQYQEAETWPELKFNIVLKRRSVNALIINMLPLFVVAALLFGALLTIASTAEGREVHGFSTSAMIGTCSALFFVVMLAHIRLRELFAGTNIVYLEYFYFFMYGVLLMVSVNTYLFSTKSALGFGFIHYRDNLMVKLAYWPVVLGGMVLITLWAL